MNNFFTVPTSDANPSAKRNVGRTFSPNNSDDKSEERGTDAYSFQDNSTRDGVESIRIYPDDVSASEPTKLFASISKRNWPAVVKRCKGDYAKEARTWVVEKNRDGSVRWKLLPIHQACENKAPSEVIKALIAVHPDSLLMKDSAGDLPLHLACRERCSKSVIAALLSEEPNAAKVKDDEGRLPIHLASRQGSAVQIIDSLIICYFRGVRTPDAYELLPIHWACAQNASPALVEALLRANPDSVDLKDKWGRTPLSLCHASTNPDKEAIIDLLNKDPSSWNTNLNDEIETLTQKLERSAVKEKQSEMKLQDLANATEMKMRELEDEAETKFQELQFENSKLKEEVTLLTSTNKYSEDDLNKINDENFQLTKDIKVFQSRLHDYAQIFQTMEEQRMSLLAITSEMEKTIHRASLIVHDEKLKPKTKKINSKDKKSSRY
jgi:hypothetical protein